MEEQGDTAVLPAPTQLAPPTPKVIRMKSPSPGFRGRSQTPVRGRSTTPLMRYREKSETPSAWRSITPFISREEKEKTPFEIGPNILLQLASYKAIIDKALVMDISMEEEAPAKFIISEQSVIDRAAVMDISNVEIIYVEDDFDYDSMDGESYRDSESPSSVILESEGGESIEGGEGEEAAPKEKKKKKGKKVVKKKEKKEKEASPPKLKLDMPEKPKISKAKLFEQQQAKEEKEKAAEKPPPKRKGGKLTGALAAMQAEEAKQKEAEEQKRIIEEKMKKMKAEQEAKKQADAEARDEGDEEEQEEHEEHEESEMPESGDEHGSEDGGSDEESGGDQSGSGSERGSDEEDGESHAGTEDGDGASSMGRRGSQSSEDEFTRPNYDEEWTKMDADGQGVIRSTYERKQHKKLSERERDQEWQKRRESTRIPRIHTHLKDVAIEEGHNVKLTCTATGPELSIKWLRDGNPIERGPKYRILVNEGMLILEIMRALPSDSAEYTCSLGNINGEASTSAIVTVYDVIRDDPIPPTFTSARGILHTRSHLY